MKAWLQISSGRGPVECCWTVAQVLRQIRSEAKAAGLRVDWADSEPGPAPGTCRSAMVAIDGEDAAVAAFIAGWRGTIQWTGDSRFRPHCKRRNFFVGVASLREPDELALRAADIRFETMRASGPGGQHVNTTESAVRAVHLPTGLSAIAMEERSQHQNRKLALARLADRVERLNQGEKAAAREEQWMQHWTLERGNAVRVYAGEDFHRKR